MALVSVDKVAKALNTGVRSVQRLVLEGMPRAERGRYDIGQCLLWYVRYLQKIIESKGLAVEDAVGASLRQERQRLIKAQADREELELGARRGELVPVAMYEQEVGVTFNVLRQRLLTLPAQLAPHLEGENRAVIKARLDKAIREALTALVNEFANGTADHTGTAGLDSPGQGPSGAPAAGSASDAEGQRVGRAKSHPA
jgi:phage terminase Nu1 subunit (DNA packaging protein)